MKKILILCSMFLTSCCYNNMKVLLEEPDFRAEKRVLVYEDNSNSSAAKLLRASLRKEGIKVLKYTTSRVASINEKISSDYREKNTEMSVYDCIDGSPYVISISSNTRPDVVCLVPWQDVTLYQNITIEITNLTTKEVVFSIDADGLDGDCGYCSGSVFDKIAKKIAAFWNQSEETE